MKKIEQLGTVLEVLLKFIEDHEGIVDSKTKADIVALLRSVEANASAAVMVRDDVAVARTGRDDSFVNLQRSILGCKKAVEMVVIRDEKGVVVPLIGQIINNPARIHVLAGKVLRAAAQAGDDPALAKTAKTLQNALDRYVDAYNETYEKVSTAHTTTEEKTSELVTLNGQVRGFKLLVAFRSTKEQRQELNNRLKAALPRKSHKAAAPVQTTTQATLPIATLPAVPATVVPPSSEHPIVPTGITELRRDGVTPTVSATA